MKMLETVWKKDALYLKVIDHLQTTLFKLVLVDPVEISMDLHKTGILYCLFALKDSTFFLVCIFYRFLIQLAVLILLSS